MKLYTPADIEKMAAGSAERGDLRIGTKLVEFRTEFGVPRKTLSAFTGVSVTSITRIELGQRMFTTHSLTHMIKGARGLVKLMDPRRGRTADKWALELIDIIAEVEEDRRVERLRSRQQEETE